ncbi:MAG: alkaline phosphatase, partial [Alloalcanivorax xenomutans]
MLFSPRVRLILSLVAAFFLVFVVLRGAFFWFFLSGLELPSQELWHAFGIGVRFDLRLALLIVLPVAILSLLPGLLGLRRGQLARKLAVAWLALASAVACFVYIADFAHYSYLEERLNSSVLRFLTNRGDSLQMVW